MQVKCQLEESLDQFDIDSDKKIAAPSMLLTMNYLGSIQLDREHKACEKK